MGKILVNIQEGVHLMVYKLDTGGYVGLDERYLGEVEDGVSSPYDIDGNEAFNLSDDMSFGDESIGAALQDAHATLLRWREAHPDEWDERDEITFNNILIAKRFGGLVK